MKIMTETIVHVLKLL